MASLTRRSLPTREKALLDPGTLLQQVDEALWAAYRKYDRSQVTRHLLQRYLTPRRAAQNELVTREAGC